MKAATSIFTQPFHFEHTSDYLSNIVDATGEIVGTVMEGTQLLPRSGELGWTASYSVGELQEIARLIPQTNVDREYGS